MKAQIPNCQKNNRQAFLFKWLVFMCKLTLGQRNLEIKKMDINPPGEAYANLGLGMGSLNLSSTSHNLTITQDSLAPKPFLLFLSMHHPNNTYYVAHITQKITKEEFSSLTMNRRAVSKWLSKKLKYGTLHLH